jgi:VWFA-related protein
VLLAGTIVSAQQPAPETRSPFRTDVEAVEIDVRVLDDRGQPVPGLTAGDFEVFEEDVRQDIRAFTTMHVPVVPRPRTAGVEPDTQTNRVPFDGRIYVFVLDDLHTHPLRSTRAKAAVRQFLDRYLAANDRAAIVTTSGRAESTQELTASRPALLQAVDAFHGRKLRSSTLDRLGEYYRLRDAGELKDRQRINDPYEQERVHQARRSLTSLRDVARWLDTVPARRKALIFVSEGIDYDLTNLIDNRFASGLLADVQDAIAGAVRSNTSIYSVDPRGLGGIEEETIEVSGLPDDTTDVGPSAFMAALRMTQDSLRVLAEQTGGFALVNTNDLAGAFGRLVRENSEYYVLAYQPANTRRDGRYRRIEVKVKRPGMRVVTRDGYYARKDGERASDVSVPGPAAMRALLDSPLPVAGLPLDTTVKAFRGGKGKASVLITAEIGPEFTLAEKSGLFQGRVDLTTIAVGMNGKIAASDHRGIDLNLRPATRENVLRHGIRTTARLELAPGRYQLRIAARDTGGGRAGSVLHDLVIPDYDKAGLGMSDLLLASQGAVQTATTNVDEPLKQVLTVPPTVARAFSRADVLTVFAELYDNPKQDVAPVAVLTTMTDAAGRVVYRAEEALEGGAFESPRRAYPHSATIALKDVAPGTYIVRVAASSRAGLTVAREVSVTVRDDRTVAD